jgi:hypothetical protein
MANEQLSKKTQEEEQMIVRYEEYRSGQGTYGQAYSALCEFVQMRMKRKFKTKGDLVGYESDKYESLIGHEAADLCHEIASKMQKKEIDNIAAYAEQVMTGRSADIMKREKPKRAAMAKLGLFKKEGEGSDAEDRHDDAEAVASAATRGKAIVQIGYSPDWSDHSFLWLKKTLERRADDDGLNDETLPGWDNLALDEKEILRRMLNSEKLDGIQKSMEHRLSPHQFAMKTRKIGALLNKGRKKREAEGQRVLEAIRRDSSYANVPSTMKEGHTFQTDPERIKQWEQSRKKWDDPE